MEEVQDFLVGFHVKHGIWKVHFYFDTLASKKLEIK